MNTYNSDAADRETMMAVAGQDISFYFGRKKECATLNNVNIAVKRGTIYSLLGPSGCGKTTLLKCIVGQHKPQGGFLKVFGRSPGSKGFFIPGRGVGYMPQELALYKEMTTEEILTYFGTLYSMSMTSISERITFLVELLKLPHKTKLIQHLSGGQQRRVSFAIALIHKPPLLVLDEPTVGVDPLLRKAVWDHLVSIAKKEHSAIILTTHYTEEARQAHTVGLMRSGQLLVERNPEDLIKQYGGFTLEDVFLKVCQGNGNEGDDCETNIDELIVDRNLGPKRLDKTGMVRDESTAYKSCADAVDFVNMSGGTFDQRNDFHYNSVPLVPLPSFSTESGHATFRATNAWMRLFYLTRKNVLRLKRNTFLTISIISLVVLQAVIFFLCLSSDPFDLPMAVVNEEVEGLNKFSERFLLAISNRTIYKKPFNNFTLAYESLKTGESSAALRINSEFSTCLVDRAFEGVHASNDTILCSKIKLILDTSNYFVATTIRSSLLESYQTFARDLLISLGKSPLLSEISLQFEEYPVGSKPATVTDFIAPGFILCAVYLISMALTEIVLIEERKEGLMSRTIVAGATTTEILLSFFFGLFVMVVLQIVSLLLISFCGFSLSCKGSVFWVIVASTLTGICGMSHGFIISAVIDDESAACLMGVGSFMSLLFLSASFWPLESMTYYLRYLSYCLSLTRIVESTRSVTTRGWSIEDNYIWDGYLICSSWAALQMILSIILLKRRK